MQVKTAVISMVEARMYSSVAAAPSRVPVPSGTSSTSTSTSTSRAGDSKEEKENEEVVTVREHCSPTAVRHHIVLYAPDTYLAEDYEWGEVLRNMYLTASYTYTCRL